MDAQKYLSALWLMWEKTFKITFDKIIEVDRFPPPTHTHTQGTWRTLHPRRILHAPGAISVHGGLWLVTSLEPGPSGLKSNALPTRLTRPALK